MKPRHRLEAPPHRRQGQVNAQGPAKRLSGLNKSDRDENGRQRPALGFLIVIFMLMVIDNRYDHWVLNQH